MTELRITIPEDFDFQQPGVEHLLWAYAHGLFPMADPLSGEMEWFMPEQRGILPLDDFHVPTNVSRLARQGKFDIRVDTAFEPVMRACSKQRSGDDLSWIDDRLIRSYTALHEHGNAHSVEAWRDGELVGGLYGVHQGGAFFGESMFHDARGGGSGASKVCLVHLVERLNRGGFTLLDCQFWNPHLDQFGCVEISRGEYMRRLGRALKVEARWEVS